MDFANLVKKKHIYLDHKGLRDDDLGVLKEVLQKGQVLEVLSLRGNWITISDDNFTDALASNRNLRFLYLSWNKIGNEGAKRLARALKANQVLQEIHLYDNRFGNEAFKSLTDSLKANKSLQVMDLASNDIVDEAAVQILEGLVCNQSSFEALCGSNHQIEYTGVDLGAHGQRSTTLQQALEINGRKGCSMNQKCRSKLRKFYFQGDFDVHPFIHMDIVFMPNILELVTMSEHRILGWKERRSKKGARLMACNGHLGSIYRLIGNCHSPELFSFPSQQIQLEQLDAGLETTIGSLKETIG